MSGDEVECGYRLLIADNWAKDSRTDQPCPQCGWEIVYNGSYFCSQFDGGDCRWAMEECEAGSLFRRCFSGLMLNRVRTGSDILNIVASTNEEAAGLARRHALPLENCYFVTKVGQVSQFRGRVWTLVPGLHPAMRRFVRSKYDFGWRVYG